MKLATYNVENLFNRAKVMNHTDWNVGRDTLAAYANLNSLLGEKNYTASRKKKMVTLMVELGLQASDRGPDVILRRNRGELLKRKAGGIEIIADGRADWVGSLDLLTEPVDHESMLNTARVIEEVNADILAVVEAESRPALKMFCDKIIPSIGGSTYENVMVIDGNDERGIDVGLATKSGYDIEHMRSHVHERVSPTSYIFSRDCAEYAIDLPGGSQLLVMVNHFKSKGYGSPAESNARRLAQAERVRELYDERLKVFDLIALVGDLNDTPDSTPLKPLHHKTSMKDIFAHSNFDDGGYPGTYGLCGKSNKIDYIFLSPDLFSNVKTAGAFRKGMWPGKRPVRWDTYAELTKPSEAGSDHACLWAEVDL